MLAAYSLFSCIAVIPAVLSLACGGSNPRPATAPNPQLDPIRSFVADRQVIYVHVTPTVTAGDSVSPSKPFGVVEPIPAVTSERHQDLLRVARQSYDQGRYLDAVQPLRQALADEPDNPFFLNEYARTLFRIDSLRPASGRAYEQLVKILTDRQSPPPNALVVDMWFIDAYWKLGLLYLDVGEYAKAFVEFAKVSVARPSDAVMLEQLYGYLAEACFHLSEHAATDWFISKTLEINPQNRYVLQFRTPR